MIDLPPSLMMTDIAYRCISPHDLTALRATFSKETKPAFLQYLAENHAGDLQAMGLGANAIDHMRNGKLPRNHPGEQLDCSIDHILSLHLGGTNEFDNLMLIPSRINALKDQLETTQLKTMTGMIKTIIPVDGAKVPFIPGGFQRARAAA